MSGENHPVTWPQKIRRFGIEDPFLRFLASRYESEIPWQKTVRNERDLLRFVRREMLPSLVERLVSAGANSPDQRYFLQPSEIRLERVLAAEAHLTAEERAKVEKFRRKKGEEAARGDAARLINRKKQDSFREWIRKVRDQWFRSQHAFVYLVLRGMIDALGKKTLRVLHPPDRRILTWLQNRMRNERLRPNSSLSKEYWWLATLWTELPNFFGSSKPRSLGTTENGWAFFPRHYDAFALSQICQRTGWCLANPYIASRYLEDYGFFIFFQDRRPRVAVETRQEWPNFKIAGIYGLYNSSPKEHRVDIKFFIKTTPFDWRYVYEHEDWKGRMRIDKRKATREWWKERITNWPFLIDTRAPPAIQEEFGAYAESRKSLYEGFPGLPDHGTQWVERTRENPVEEQCVVLREKPFLLEYFRQSPSYQSSGLAGQFALGEAAIEGWLQLLRDGVVPSEAFPLIPRSVRNSPQVIELFAEQYPQELHERIRALKKTRSDREKPFQLEDLFIEQVDEPGLLAEERMVEALLHDKSGLLNNHVFSSLVRERPDFPQLRREAWKKAMEVEPPLWFALPQEFLDTEGFTTSEGPVRAGLDAERWLETIRQKPWILLQPKFPQSLRRHRDFLVAYHDRWVELLREHPWRLWEQINPSSLTGKKHNIDPTGFRNYRRVYPSYALLRSPVVLEAMTEGWLKTISREPDECTVHLSGRMMAIPAVQLSLLRAIDARARKERLPVKIEFATSPLTSFPVSQVLKLFTEFNHYSRLHDQYGHEIRKLLFALEPLSESEI